ncbi:unnamed protein product [Callosobruchus maculatus]|uniref:Uncharacterized protein n=1 Tax=Callosobruchus maculatus TaxID=64391 RepID=A0A653BKC2_CALMS|nr:unnamed protein product [Callosobruchus maculatus]
MAMRGRRRPSPCVGFYVIHLDSILRSIRTIPSETPQSHMMILILRPEVRVWL